MSIAIHINDKRYIWSEEQTEYLINYWPHFGTYGIEKILPFNRKQIKNKVNKLKLVLLPKNQRLCVICKQNYQYSRSAGLRCKNCQSNQRKNIRKTTTKIFKRKWMKTFLNTLKYRDKVCDLDVKYLLNLWRKQRGKCFYSGLKMLDPKYGSGRRFDTASLDRINCNFGYLKGNVVWCCWICNIGKWTLSQTEYIKVCGLIYNKWDNNTEYLQKI